MALQTMRIKKALARQPSEAADEGETLKERIARIMRQHEEATHAMDEQMTVTRRKRRAVHLRTHGEEAPTKHKHVNKIKLHIHAIEAKDDSKLKGIEKGGHSEKKKKKRRFKLHRSKAIEHEDMGATFHLKEQKLEVEQDELLSMPKKVRKEELRMQKQTENEKLRRELAALQRVSTVTKVTLEDVQTEVKHSQEVVHNVRQSMQQEAEDHHARTAKLQEMRQKTIREKHSKE